MIPDSNVLNWIISPAANCVQYVTEETKLASLIQRSLITLQGQELFLQIARQRFAEGGVNVAPIDALLAEQPTLSDWAKAIIDSDFDAVNSHGLVGIWCAVEVAVEDTAVLILMNDPTALVLLQQAGIKTSNVTSGSVSEADGRRLYRRFEAKLRNTHLVGESYVEILRTLRVMISPKKSVLEQLAEINAVRNCLLHRAGLIDDLAVAQAPNLHPYLGKKIPITSGRYQDYFAAIGEFANDLLNAAVNSPFVSVQLKHPSATARPPHILKVHYDQVRQAVLGIVPQGRSVLKESVVSGSVKLLRTSLGHEAGNLGALVSHVLADLEARQELRSGGGPGSERVQRVGV